MYPLHVNTLRLTPEIVNLIAELDEFKGRWTATRALAPDRLAALRQVATIESVGSSTRIEGVKLTNSEVEALLRGLKTYSFRSRDEQEVAGYAEVMELLFTSYSEIPITENHIKQLHGALLKHSTKDERHRGEYKKFLNHVEAFDAVGKSKGIIFKTASPFNTPQLMKELIEWTNAEITKKELHALLIVAVFAVVFLQIHPFQDGNGRLSRALTTLLLLRLGYSYAPYSSLERVIEENKDGYYLALRRAQVELETAKPSLHKKLSSTKKDQTEGMTSWFVYFLRAMQKQKSALEAKLKNELIAHQLSPLSLSIIELIKSRGQSSIAELVALTRANRNTIKVHLRQLVANKLIAAIGTGRGVRYTLLV